MILKLTVDVINARLNSKIVKFSDEWFAAAENLIKPSAPIYEKKFVPTGAWYDGWETRRHNPEPSDWVIIKLGVSSANIIGAEVDTAFFTGNYAPAISVEGTFVTDESALDSAKWDEIIPQVECGPSNRFFWLREKITDKAYTHVRLQQYPDGGIARFRLYGTPVAVWPQDVNEIVDLAHVSNGGVAIKWSDAHFDTPANLLLPGRGVDMGDGWETARSRGKDHTDWAIIRLGSRGTIDNVVVDTAFFIGNYPQYITVEGVNAKEGETVDENSSWKPIVGKSKTGPDREHIYKREELQSSEKDQFTHVKLTMIPDGGVKRLRIFGRRVPN